MYIVVWQVLCDNLMKHKGFASTHIQSSNILVPKMWSLWKWFFFFLFFISNVFVSTNCGPKSNRKRKTNITSTWKNESPFNMNSLKDKTCYLRNAKHKLNKNVRRYNNFIYLNNVFNGKNVRQSILGKKEERKPFGPGCICIEIFWHSFNLQFDNWGKICLDLKFSLLFIFLLSHYLLIPFLSLIINN